MSEPIAAIAQVITSLPPGLTADEIAQRVWTVVQTADPTSTPPDTFKLTAEQQDLLRACREAGSLEIGTSSLSRAAVSELAMLGLLTPAASGLDYTLWRLTPLGMKAAV